MTLLIKSGGAATLPEWQAHFAEFIPGLAVRGWDDAHVDPADVRYVLVWEPEHGRMARYAGLQLILSSAAGVDHILADPALPPHLPVVRMVTAETAQRMADFVTMSALALLRDLPKIIAAQQARRWEPELTGRVSGETTVGVMGLGQLGAAVARRLAANEFRVLGWARSAKSIAQVTCHVGPDGLDDFLAQSDIVVNLLPDTADTRGLIDAAFLARLPRGAAVINVGRGTQLDGAALLDALDSGQIGAAVLDVFATEPLAAHDPLWRHPAVIVTPHIASTVSRRARARQAARAIQAHLRGEPVPNLYERERGY